MSDYIKREDAIKALERWHISGVLLLAPVPSADVVEVVRCKDCEHGQSYNMFGSRYCVKHNDVAVKDNDYCSYGERKDEGL